MFISFNRTLAITRKETYHILRDPFTLAISIGLPVILVFIFGYAIEFNTKYLPISIYDEDKSSSSRQLVETLSSSQYFIPHYQDRVEGALNDISSEKSHAALFIPHGFERDILGKNKGSIQILLDGSDNSTVSPLLNYISLTQILIVQKLLNYKVPQIVSADSRFLFNPELNSQWFVIPGLTVVVMSVLSILLTALTVAREWENGSMELLLSTPVKPIEIIIGKLAPYGIMALMAVTFIYFVSRTVFKIPFQGSLIVFYSGCILFLITYLAQGLVISVVTRKQQLAMQFAMMTGLIPAQLLSGFIFPIESMPRFFHYFTMLLPARWYMKIARNSYLKGSMFLEMSVPFLALSLLSFFMIILATKKFKRDLEP